MNIVAAAPGKLVLLGEYAVLEGAPAVAMAIDRRAVARLTVQPGPHCEVFAPDVLNQRLPFSIDSNGLPDWQAAGAAAAKLNLVDEVLRGLADEGLAPAPGSGFKLALDTSAFFDTGNAERPKLGLGSSAALTVALAMAFVARAGLADDAASHARWLPCLLALHRKFQGGQGSGVDVATSLVGGLIAYQLNDGGATPTARPLTWPAGLHQRFIWSGRSASTPKFLAILRAWRLAHEAEYRTRMDALGAIATVAVASLAAGDAPGFLIAAASYANDLRALGLASGVSIYSEEHVAIAALAASHQGVVYKPCGAGGGDVGVLFATDPECLTAAVAQLAASGFASVPLAVDGTGLRIAITENVEA
ncbi:MAG: hypothetical protein Q8M37_13765 [Nevskia sp.]|nr:hypothetical protein [Nevskia sp.]